VNWRVAGLITESRLGIAISLIALSISSLSYLDARAARQTKLDIVHANEGWSFLATPVGVVHHAQYDVVNLTPRVVVARDFSALIAINAAQPEEIWINGEQWDYRPYSLEPDRSYRIEYLAERRVGDTHTLDWPGARFGCCDLINLYIHHTEDAFREEDGITSVLDTPQFPSEAQHDIVEHFKKLLLAGYLYSGMTSEFVAVGELDDLTVQHGGICYKYLTHLPNICSQLEVTLVTGETFASPLEVFGVRSEKILPMIERTYAEAET
jgi:hypothetical protein